MLNVSFSAHWGMRTVWSRAIMPWLVDVSEAARAEAAGATVRALAQDGRLRIPSSWYTHELGRAIAHRDFKRTDTIPFPTAAMKDGHAVVVPDKALQGAWAAWPEEEISRAVAAMDRRLSTFGQRTRDVYKVLLARWLQHKSSAEERAKGWHT